jgi:hypothetical protein
MDSINKKDKDSAINKIKIKKNKENKSSKNSKNKKEKENKKERKKQNEEKLFLKDNIIINKSLRDEIELDTEDNLINKIFNNKNPEESNIKNMILNIISNNESKSKNKNKRNNENYQNPKTKKKEIINTTNINISKISQIKISNLSKESKDLKINESSKKEEEISNNKNDIKFLRLKLNEQLIDNPYRNNLNSNNLSLINFNDDLIRKSISPKNYITNDDDEKEKDKQNENENEINK